MRYLSLFSGMECAWQAWHPLGWECAAVAEIDARACELLAHRLPHVPNLGSVTDITDAQIAALGPIDVVIGGSPCQDLSNAGKRAGLAGARSGLFHQQLRIFHAARHFCGARWLVWENVPGAFSSNNGRDFAVVAGSMAGLELTVPEDGWGTEGVAVGENGLVEWAVLDAQWFGVAQRRRRVFAVLDTGNWADRAPVLLERESVRGDSAPRRQAGKGIAGGTSRRPDCGHVVNALTAHNGQRNEVSDAVNGAVIPVSWPADVACTLNAAFGDKQGLEDQHALSGASLFVPAIAFSCKDHAADAADDLSPTLRAMGHGASHANAGGQVAVAFVQNQRDEVREMEVAGALAAEPGAKQQTYLRQAMAVRRLTPRECERLQGVEDDWTLVPSGPNGKPMADGPRYKMLGNSFARPVITWIGKQIERATSESAMEKAA